MDEPLIWTCADIVRFTHDADAYNRNWAWCWLRRHHPVEASRQAARALADSDAGTMCSGIDAFAAAPNTESTEAIAALKRRDDLPRSVRERLEYLEHPERKPRIDDPLNDEVERLSRQPDELKRKGAAMLRGRDSGKRLIALGAIGNQQHQWASDILLECFAKLLTSGDPTIVWDTVDSLCDPRFLPAISAAWIPGERVIASLYERIHHLAGFSTPLPEGIAGDAEAERERAAKARALREANRHAAKRAPRRLDIQCTACGRTGDYEYEREAIGKLVHFDGAASRDMKLPREQVFLCKYCGAKNAYEISLFSKISAHGALETLEADEAEEAKKPKSN